VHIRKRTRTLSGTGLDGSLSSLSGTSPDQSPSDVSSAQLGSLIPSNFPSSKSRDVRSDTSGSINWEKSWPKRKPRRRHDTSENSGVDLPTRPLVESYISEDVGSNICGRTQLANTAAPEEEGDQQSQLHTIQECALKSCPDLHRQSLHTVTPVVPRASVSFHAPRVAHSSRVNA